MGFLAKAARAISKSAVYGTMKYLNSRKLPTDATADQFQYETTNNSADGSAYLGGGSALPNGLVTYGGNPVTYGGSYVTYGV